MLEPLIEIHEQVLANTPKDHKRYLYDQIDWQAQSVCLMGSRGVGKTTLLCQHIIETDLGVGDALYISADNLHVLSNGLFQIVQQFFKYGGKVIYIDEVHKYPDWSLEIKNLIDTYKDRQIIFSASSILDLKKSKYDLSRRVIYYELQGLSFREYLQHKEDLSFDVLSLEDILSQHTDLARNFVGMDILKQFRSYLVHGYFPFFLESEENYLAKLTNVIEKIISEDIASVYNLKQVTLLLLKKLLWFVATSTILVPNIEKISKNLDVSREAIYNALSYLDQAGLLNNILPDSSGIKLIRKPGKMYLENTNLYYAINGSLKLETNIGNVRETFFANQLKYAHRVNTHPKTDFLIDGQTAFEIGGKSKNDDQIRGIENAYIAADDIEVSFGRKIPLYLFGFLY